MTPEEEAETREVMSEVIANINHQIIEITDGTLKQRLLNLAKKHGWGNQGSDERE